MNSHERIWIKSGQFAEEYPVPVVGSSWMNKTNQFYDLEYIRLDLHAAVVAERDALKDACFLKDQHIADLNALMAELKDYIGEEQSHS